MHDAKISISIVYTWDIPIIYRLSEYAWYIHGIYRQYTSSGYQMVLALMISSNWNVKDVTTKYWSNPARFRDLIREIKQRADLGWVHMVIGTSTMSSIWNVKDMNAKYSSTPAKFRNLITKIKQRADLGWSWAVQMVIGTSRSDWNVEDVTANNSSTPAKFKFSSMM